MKKAIRHLEEAKNATNEFISYRVQNILNAHFTRSEVQLFILNAADYLDYSLAIAKLKERQAEEEKRHISSLVDVLVANAQDEDALLLVLVAFKESIEENTLEEFLQQHFRLERKGFQ